MKIKSTLKSTASTALPVLLTLLVLSVHQAYASSCFTDTGGHWAENFICWMKTTGLSSGYPDGTFRPDNSITRAEVAALLYKEASGDTYINMGQSAWQVDSNSLPTAYVWHESNAAILRSTATGHSYFEMNIPILTALHHQQMTVKGAKVCYNALLTAGASVIQVFVGVYHADGGVAESVQDLTTRKDQGCRVYTLTTPVVLASTDSLIVFLGINLTATTDYVAVFGTTAIQGFNPTAGVLAPSPSFPGTVPGVMP